MTPALARSWVVEASAGTGKTTALVNRIVDAIAAGTPVETIVAVTFTHAAAGNMKLRVRHQLEHRRAQTPDASTRDRLAEAARSLDRAFIGTIHAFCAQLLRQHPVEAGVDPDFQELAQPDALRVFGRVFRRWIEGRLASPSPALARALARLAWRSDRDSEPLDELRKAAWNLAEWRDFDAPWEPRDFDRDAGLHELLEKSQATLELRNRCSRQRDPLYDSLRPLAEFLDRVRRGRDADGLDMDLVENDLLRLPRREIRWLNKGGGKYGEGVSREAVLAGWEELKSAIEAFGRKADADLAVQIRAELWQVAELYQQEKRRAGQLDFMDLLLYARDLLRNDFARAALQGVYQRIFVDEFQDTEPLQAEILILLASADPAERDWRNVTPVAGKLYVVGDPKQSIYRFRRADAHLFRRICRSLTDRGAGSEELTRSTRSTSTIQQFVNAAFEPLIPDYLPLDGGVLPPPNQPGILALPMPHPYGPRNISQAKIDACSPNAVAAFIEWLCQESGWKVRDRSSGDWVGIRPEHVCILFRRFTNYGTDLTQEYVRCLEARGIAHQLVGSKSFHRREEVGTLRAALRAVEWPDDELSVFAVLRGSLYAVPDDILLKFRNVHGRFHPMRELPEEFEADFAPIFQGLQLLGELHRRRNYRPIADTIHALLEGTRAHAGFAFRKGGERVLANVYRLTDLARSFEVSGAATSFRAFVEYLENEAESSDTSEAPVLEQEGGGVQLMTVHKAKGLEFPIVILADLTAKLTGPQGTDRHCDADSRLCAQRILGCAPWQLLEAEAEEAQADYEEALRVAYVAATRARDLLVVAAIGDERRAGWLSPLYDALYPSSERWRNASPAPGCPPFADATVLSRPPEMHEEVSVRPGLHRPVAGDHQVVWFDPAVLRLRVSGTAGVENERVLRGTTEQAVEGLRRYHEWKARRTERIEAGRTPRFHVATAESFGQVDEAAHIEVETVTLAAIPGRPTGRKFGRVVHDILQHAGRAADVDALAPIWGRRHGAAEADCQAAADAARQALAYIESAMPPGASMMRELPVMVKLTDGTLVEGRIDCAWRGQRGWTVVDYKTDRRAHRDVAQVRLYALALESATGTPARCIVLEI